MMKFVAVLLSACLLSLVAATASSARDTYPHSVKKAFVTACVDSATSKGSVTKKQAKAYCKSAFGCIERKLTLNQFKKAATKDAGKSNKKILKCEKKALKVIS